MSASAPTATPTAAAVRRVLAGAVDGAVLAAGATLAFDSPSTPVAPAPVPPNPLAADAWRVASANASRPVDRGQLLREAEFHSSGRP